MPFVLCYTREGSRTYPDHNYPGHTALICDLYHALHLAVSEDGVHYTPMRNNTGILFPDAVYQAGDGKGVTKTLQDPWLFRGPDGNIMLICVRRSQHAPDLDTLGYLMLYTTHDLVHFTLERYLPVMHGHEIRHPACRYKAGLYHLSFEADGESYTAESTDLYSIFHLLSRPVSTGPAADFGIPGCVPGNVLSITDDEADMLQSIAGRIFHTETGRAELTVPAGTSLPEQLPGVPCFYSDGSSHTKRVVWDVKALKAVDTSRPGTWHISGKVLQRKWPFPIPVNFGDDPTLQFPGMSDPCITEYHGRYILTSTGTHHIHLRIAETPEAVFSQPPLTICTLPLNPGESFTGTWAAELHEIDGTPYLFTAICPGGEWTHVRACVLRCRGDIANPDDWEAPRFCIRKDGSPLEPDGISLDMTWFRDNGRDYVIWSDRIIHYGTDPLKIDSANLFIAAIDPAAPWQLASDPVCLLRPRFGWDRCETEVDEAPYMLRKNGMLYVTFSGSSTSMGDLYTVGLLMAKSGDDLLNPTVWSVVPYPLLASESAPNQYGPGHNCFLRDPETGDDLMVYHAIPHDAADRMMHRQPGIRRVHWTKCGLPCLELTPEDDLNPALTDTELTLRIV